MSRSRCARVALAAVGTILGSGPAAALLAQQAPHAAAVESSASPASTTAPTAPRAPGYDRDVRPLLADRCFRCHGPDEAARKAKLRLDEPPDPDRRTGAVLVPGMPDRSELWHRLVTGDPDDRMPPPDSGRPPLDAEELDLIRRWIEGGAAYEPHWSFVAPERPPVPTPTDAANTRNEVDAFVAARLARHGLSPSPAAPPAALLRRLFLTLTGLPPSPAEIASFLQDPGERSYDAWVDRLLDEEPYRSRFAERMATPWLDGARYADTSGIHMDNGRQMWAWRDWVLRAYRDNMPFDRFVTEQLAGDLLPDATTEQKVATGFHRCHVTTDEGGAISEEYLVEYAVDRTATTGAVFLGLTLGCARCHEHKFDPVSQEEFYGFYAFFNSIDEPGLYSQTKDSQRAYEPFLRVPTAQQLRQEERLQADLASAELALDTVPPEEEAEHAAFYEQLHRDGGLAWVESEVTAATSRGGADLAVESDGVVRCSGPNPDRDHHEIRLRTAADGLRLLCLEVLTDEHNVEGRVGRADNGNAVLQAIDVQVAPLDGSAPPQPVELVWAWASDEQQNHDHAVVNALRDGDRTAGWALGAHNRPAAPSAALFLAGQPFGFDGGSEVVVTLHYDSVYARHVFSRVRLSLGRLDEAGCDRLPEAKSGWYSAGPFDAQGRDDVWEHGDGPELATAIDPAATFAAPTGGDEASVRRWRYRAEFRDGRINELAAGQNRHYVAQRVLAPTARQRELSLGSDDGYRLYLDGTEVAGNRVDRGVAADQERTTIALPRGEHVLVMKVVNTGGAAGFYLAPVARDDELAGDLVGALLPRTAAAPFAARIRSAWRQRFSAGYAGKVAQRDALRQELAALDAAMPRTMVMRELDEPRPAYVLQRGQYDKPDTSRPIPRGVPAALGSLPADAPRDRLGLAQWLVADDNPLFARVQVNRLWELVFGTGIVRTSEDFGMQGEWPSHPALLDWLAVEFRQSGYDVRHVLRLLTKSATFRQLGRVRPDAREVDPDNRLLAWFPRRRLSAEQLRDQALFVSGLLVERLGGPSVKPYQPEGLWREVAMLGSNTRTYEPGSGDDLHRRSLYTYYKRACPPPSMLVLDAPTREFCTVRRLSTNTPLQALVLWNDDQFVEAARALARRAMDAGSDDRTRLHDMFVRCTSRTPADGELSALQAALDRFRARFAAAPADAEALLGNGLAPAADMPAADPSAARAELAALTLVGSAILNLDSTLCVP